MQETTSGLTTTFDDVQQAAGDFAFELDKPGGVNDLMMDFGNTTAESMDRAEKSVQGLSCRQEKSYSLAFHQSRMNQTLFEQLGQPRRR